MKIKIEKQIEKHSKSVDLLSAIGKITHSIDAYSTTTNPEMYLNRLKRQRDILLKEYNDGIELIQPFRLNAAVDMFEIKLDARLHDPIVKTHITPRVLNGLRRYFHLHVANMDPKISDVLEVDLDEFMLVRWYGNDFRL